MKTSIALKSFNDKGALRPTLAVSLSMQHNKALDKELSAIRRFLLPRWQEKHAMYEKLGVAVKGGPFATPDKSMCKFTSVFLETALPALGLVDAELAMGHVVNERGERFSHHWITADDDYIIDLTAAQFGGPEMVYTSSSSDVYESMPSSPSLEDALYDAREAVDCTVSEWLDDFFTQFSLHSDMSL